MSKVLLVPLKESVSSPFAKNVCGPADPGSIVQLSISTETWRAPAPPPPRVWKHPEPSTSPQVWVPSAERSNSAQAQKPPRLGQKSGLLQLNEMPTCHMSWLAPPPYAAAVDAVPTIRAAETTSDAITNRTRRIDLSLLLCALGLEGPRALEACGFAASRKPTPELRSLGSARHPQ